MGRLVGVREACDLGREWLNHAKRTWDPGSLCNSKQVVKWARTELEGVSRGRREGALGLMKDAGSEGGTPASVAAGSDGRSGADPAGGAQGNTHTNKEEAGGESTPPS